MKFWKWMALGVCVACLIPAISHSAASPQDDYLQIYVLINEGDKLTQSGQNSQGREKYETALTRLDKLKNENPEWEPTIVKYRIKYLNEKLDSLKSGKDSSPAPKPAPSSPPATPSPSTSSSSSDSTASPEEKTPALQSKSEAPASLPNSSPAVTGDDPSALRQKIISLSGELESARTELRQTKNELESAVSAKKQLQEKLAASPSPDGNVAKLQEENTTLRNKLTAAEDSLKKAAGGELAGEMTSLRGQVDTLEKKLAEANGKSAELSRANDDYKKQIASMTSQLQMAGTAGKSDSTLAKENAMLRSILDRQLKEQARREAARRLVLDEFKNLAVSTEALKTQMDVLSSPLVALTDEEQGMLKVSAPSLVAPDPGSPSGNAPTISGSSEKPASPESYAEKPRIPDEFKETAAKATALYNEKKFDESAAAYQQILAKYPQSIYALSNLGVVRFQQQKYPEAEKALREAIRVAPNDAFSHSVLGIALVQQEKYDDAIQILSRAVALDPNDAKTRNYLGISSSRRGLQEAAEQECRKAIELDEGYGDAHFNLAVIYATQNPPSKELAKRHYTRALELGVPKDPELEKLLN